MKFERLVLKNFGKFQDKEIVLKDGINICYGGNESGKSTIHTFIESMIFGMERKRGRASAMDDFSRYEPWENKNYYAGSLEFESGGKHFLLTRNFDKYTKDAKLICKDDGEELGIPNGDLQEILDGMEKSIYENTISLAQLGTKISDELITELTNYAANYYAAGDQEIRLEAALEYLKGRKKETQKRQIREREEKQAERERLEMEASYVWRDIHRIETELDEVQGTLEAYEIKELEKESAKAYYRQEDLDETAEESKWRVHPVELAGMFSAVVLCFLILQRPWSFLSAIVVVLASGLYIWNRVKDGKRKQSPEEVLEGTEELSKEKLVWKKEHLKGMLREKQIQYENLREKEEELDEMSDEFKAAERRCEALELASQKLSELAQEIQKEAGGKFNKRLSDIFSQITKGAYDRIAIGKGRDVKLFCKDRIADLRQVSKGTIEQVYFALRMTAIEVLCEEEFPVILDETFAFYDQERLETTLRWLYKNKKQVLIFTCQTREIEALEYMGIPTSVIEL